MEEPIMTWTEAFRLFLLSLRQFHGLFNLPDRWWLAHVLCMHLGGSLGGSVSASYRQGNKHVWAAVEDYGNLAPWNGKQACSGIVYIVASLTDVTSSCSLKICCARLMTSPRVTPCGCDMRGSRMVSPAAWSFWSHICATSSHIGGWASSMLPIFAPQPATPTLRASTFAR